MAETVSITINGIQFQAKKGSLLIDKLIDELLTIVKILFDHYHIFRILILNCDISSTSRFSVRIIWLALLLNLVVLE